MGLLYLDNAATSWPKPPSVYRALGSFLADNGANPGRGGHQMAVEAARQVFGARERVATLFGWPNSPERFVFTPSATQAINMVVFGMLHAGDRVVVSGVEHNAVTRPLHVLAARGVRVEVVPPSPTGLMRLDDMAAALKEPARLVAVAHASNVLGTIQPIGELAELAHEHGALFLVDGAQAAGELEVDLSRLAVDFYAFAGHKGLLGPPGTGGLYIREGRRIEPLVYGGTGSRSESPEPPETLPDRYESGTQNSVGVVGLGAGVEYVMERGTEEIRRHSLALTTQLLNGLAAIPGVNVYGPLEPEQRVGLVAFNVREAASTDIAHILDSVYGIESRGGLHCAPAAHRVAGTLGQGAVRLSPGVFTTEEEIDSALAAVREIAGESA